MGIQLQDLLVGLALGWLTLAAGLLVYRRLRLWWRKRQYGLPIDHSAMLAKYCRLLTGAQSREALAGLLSDDLPRVLGATRTLLLLPEEYQLVATGEGDLRLAINHAAVRWVASAGEAQRADQGQLRALIQQGRTDLAWTQVWAPLMRGVKLHGLWLLGAREHGLSYASEDLRWLSAVAREAAAALETLQHAEQERQVASEMRALYRQMVTTREVERGRLSRELHDGVLQDLCAVTRDLKALEAQTNNHEGPFADLAERSSESVQALRAVCNDLRPPLLQNDLGSALKALVGEMDARSPAPVHIEINAQAEDLNLPDETALAVFRITQEALNNAIQHADASEIAVRLTRHPDRLRLTVTDDGRGITGNLESARFVAQGHYGLAGMRERAAMIGGKLDVQTAIDYGTVVVLELSS